jgi:hypothetical protein
MRALAFFIGLATLAIGNTQAAGEFQAGAAVVDVSPPKLPVLVNGGMLSRYIDKIKTPVNARALVIGDGQTLAALVVVDSCMMGRALLDEAKALAAERTGIPADRMLISATHTHTAPSCMGALGTDADQNYIPHLKQKLVEAIVAAKAALRPARVGFGQVDAAEYTALRQWIRRPDRVEEDPFGNRTVRANMHAGKVLDNVTGEAGPEDPALSMISFQDADGAPLAVLANFSMHYFGDQDVSADYFGLFCEGLRQRVAPGSRFVGIMSHACSGDIFRRDYRLTEEQWKAGVGGLTIEQYANALADLAAKAHAGIKHRSDVEVRMAEQRLRMSYRLPNKQMLEWARRTVEAMGGQQPKTPTEVYAKEQILLHDMRQTDVVVQALRIGDIGIATTPCETYAVTGLKIKAASPLAHNMVIELANGGDGYIPPPEQHPFGGYNTWAARSAGLQVDAEPRIAQAAISLLEQVSGQPRKPWELSQGPAARVLAKLQPLAWWRLDEFSPPHAADSSPHHHDAHYEPGITFYLEGPHSDKFCEGGQTNRAAHFAGGRLRARLPQVADQSTISLWLWNGMPNEGRGFCGWLLSRDHDMGLTTHGENLGIGGKGGHSGRLVFQHGSSETTQVAGKTVIPRWEWQHLAFVRHGNQVRVYLNGSLELEAQSAASTSAEFFVGGRSDGADSWEGRLDEVAVFDRALSAEEVRELAGPK